MIGFLAKSINKFLHVVLALFLTTMACLVFTNVVLRYGLDSSIPWCDEASRYLFIWVIFIGALIAHGENGHLGVDVIVQRLSEKGQKIIFVINNLIILITLGLLIVGSWQYLLVTMVQRSSALDIPLAFVYSSGFIAAIGMALITVNNLYLLITNKMNSGDLVLISSEEQAKVDQVLGNSSGDKKP